MQGRRVLSPVLLVGAGTGEATCGILYLASYLRRGGIEAFVRLYDGDESEDEVARSLEALVARVRPRLVGISLKWFHHVHRALLLARTLREIDPDIRIVVGGNTASYWWRELSAFDCIDHIVLGDGERPLLALCQGEPSPPNCVTRAPDGTPRRLPLEYVQGATNSEDIYYSHFNDIFLSHQDRHAFSGWVAPGKGCAENCLYCGGARGNQKAAFGRAKPFLRSEESVRRDHQEIAHRTWQMRYDFSGSSAEFLQGTWAGVDLSHHSCMYFLWGVPRMGLTTPWPRPSSTSTWCSTSAASRNNSGTSRCAAVCSSRVPRTSSSWSSSSFSRNGKSESENESRRFDFDFRPLPMPMNCQKIGSRLLQRRCFSVSGWSDVLPSVTNMTYTGSLPPTGALRSAAFPSGK